MSTPAPLLHKLIPIATHPANGDRSARLVSPPTLAHGIYRTARGYVVTWNGQALEGYFRTEAAAQVAVATAPWRQSGRKPGRQPGPVE
jgi:hypothetical protein